jgi:Kef-type K+ transport system membrane component KefB
LSIIGQLALMLFMFLVGLELNTRLLRGKGRAITTLSIGSIGVPLAFGFAIGPVLFDKFAPAGSDKLAFNLFVGAILSVTAFPVMARILQEKHVVSTNMGAAGVAAAAVVTIGMFLLLAIAQGVATNMSAGSMILRVVGTIVLVAVVLGVVKPVLEHLARGYRDGGKMTPDLFALCIVVTLGTSFAAHQIGINVIVGGFLAGLAMPARERLFTELAPRMNDMTITFLLPVFLAFSGLKTDFTKLGKGDIAPLALLVAAGIVAKWAGGAVFSRAGGLSWREGNVLGILMNCRGLLVLVVALIAFQNNAISAQLQVGGVLMALITTMMTGPLIDKFLPGVMAAGGVPEQAPRTPETVTMPVPSATEYHAVTSKTGEPTG